MNGKTIIETLIIDFEKHAQLVNKSRMIQIKSEKKVIESIKKYRQFQDARSRIGKER